MPRTLAALAATALLTLALAGCAPAAESGSGGDGSGDTSSEGTTTDGNAYTDDTSDGTLVTISGTGDYTVPVTAPYGSYELQGNPDSQPDGCSWAVLDKNGEIVAQDQGTFVSLTDVITQFTTSGCPDWVQYE